MLACHHICNAAVTKTIISTTLAATGAATGVATTVITHSPTKRGVARGDQNLRERGLPSCLLRAFCPGGGERFVAEPGAWEGTFDSPSQRWGQSETVGRLHMLRQDHRKITAAHQKCIVSFPEHVVMQCAGDQMHQLRSVRLILAPTGSSQEVRRSQSVLHFASGLSSQILVQDWGSSDTAF